MTTSPYFENPPLFSLIFVNFRSARYLEQAIRSLCRYEEKGDFEVIVVNNDPEESLLLRYLQKSYQFRLLENGENKGFASGVNQGVSLARHPFLGFLNPDILWPAPQLSRLKAHFAEHQESILGLSLRNSAGREERFWSGRHEVTLPRLFWNHFPPLRASRRSEKEQVSWVSGGALFVPRALFESLNGMDEGYFLYYEDVDFCQRARQSGKAVYADNKAYATHFGGKSQGSQTVQKRHYRLSQERFFTKYRPLWEKKALLFMRYLSGKRAL